MEITPHLNSVALAALVGLSGRPRTHIAAGAQVRAPDFSNLLSARRPGVKPEVRRRIAAELGVPVGALTCWCDRPDGVCRARGEA